MSREACQVSCRYRLGFRSYYGKTEAGGGGRKTPPPPGGYGLTSVIGTDVNAE